MTRYLEKARCSKATLGHSSARDIQFDGLSPYAANLCPLSGGVEFAGFRENFGELRLNLAPISFDFIPAHLT